MKWEDFEKVLILKGNQEVENSGTSLVVQWLRLYALNAENLGLIPNQGTKSHLPQIRSGTAR